jgi:hypothetical protein
MRLRLLGPLAIAAVTMLAAAAILAWPRTSAYGSAQPVATLVSHIQADPHRWLGHRVSVRGRLVSLFSGNMPAPTNCAPAGGGAVRALAGADGTPLLLLGLAPRQSSWLDGVLAAIPALRGTANPPTSWPSGGWQDLEGRIVAAQDCVAAGPDALYLEVEALRVATSG